MVMDVDGTLSTEVAVKEKHPEWYFKDMVTHGIGYPNDNQGKPVPSIVGVTQGMFPKGAKNVTVGKEFLKYFFNPQVFRQLIDLRVALCLPVSPSLPKCPSLP